MTSTTGRRNAFLKLHPSDLRNPAIAWPTVALAVGGFALWVWNFRTLVALEQQDRNSIQTLAWHFFIATVAIFVLFTPAHDTAHFAIGRSGKLPRFVNEACGRLVCVPLLFPFAGLRFVHQRHHKYTNDPKRDPDHFCHEGGVLSCAIQDFYYYYYVVKNFRQVPIHVWIEILLVLPTYAMGVTWAGSWWGWQPVMWGILLPQRVAIFALVYAYDFVPHHHAEGQPHTDPYRVTKRVVGFFSEDEMELASWLLRVVLINQDAHVMHHLYPTVPFYRYHVLWERHPAHKWHKGGVETTTLF